MGLRDTLRSLVRRRTPTPPNDDPNLYGISKLEIDGIDTQIKAGLVLIAFSYQNEGIIYFDPFILNMAESFSQIDWSVYKFKFLKVCI